MNIPGKDFRLGANGLSVCTVIFICTFLSLPGKSQGSLKGPQSPPPKLSSITYDHPPNEGWIGRAGGILYTIANITLANSTTVYWAMLADSIKLSMDGGIYDGSEILDFSPATSDLAGGIAVWTGATNIPIEGGSPRSLLSKFTITLVDQDDNPLSLIDAVSQGFSANTGGILLITGNTMVFKLRIEMSVSDDGGNTYIPHLDYYDAAPTPPEAISAYSSYEFGFYWQNDPPELENLLTLNVDEGDTATITGTILKATDVESTPSDILFIVDPEKAGLYPQYGELLRSDTFLAPGDTFTMDDIDNEKITFIHDGSESTVDSIPFMVIDGDGSRYINGEDTLFFLLVNVTPSDDPPVIEVNAGMTLNEGETLLLSNAMLLTTDPESDNSSVIYTLDPADTSGFPAHGLLKLNNIPLSDGATFTQADIQNGHLIYQHDGSESVLDGFVFQVADESGQLAEENENNTFFFEVTVTPVNDPPMLTLNNVLEVNLGSEAIISNVYLTAYDAESNAQDITFTLDPDHNVELPSSGTIKLNGTTLSDGQTFTMEDINNSLVTYDHNGSINATDFFVFSVSDPDGGIASDAGFTVFHFNFVIILPDDLPNAVGRTELFTTYPNPVQDQINITFSEQAAGEVNLILFNSLGEIIWKRSKEAGLEYSIPFTDYPAGLYYLKAECNKEIQTRKLIKK
jgi:hypothetical protein